MRKRSKARECALKILYQSEITQRDISACAENFWSEQDNKDDLIKEFGNRIVIGVSEHLTEIDSMISKYATNWQLNRMAIIDKNILRQGVFELLYAQDIPPKVTINEAVELAKIYGDLESSKFVNGILDKVHKSEVLEKETNG